METKIEKQEKSQIKLQIELSKEEFQAFIEKAFLELGRETQIKGFRKGKVPKDVLEKTLGKERVLMEAGELAVEDSYEKVVSDKKLEVISHPEVKITKISFEDGMSFEANLSVMPAIILPDYKKIAGSIKKEKVEVKEKEAEGALKWVQRSRAKFSAKTGTAETGDFVEIEYWSPDVHEIGESHKKKDAFILGEGHFFKGFEDIIPGMKSGEEKKEVELEIPQDHSFKKIAGKKIKFNIILKSVQKVDFPVLNDEFARSLGNFENLDSLKKSIKGGIISEKGYEASLRARRQALEQIAENSQIEMPDVLIDKENRRMLENFKEDVLRRVNLPFEEYLKKIEKTEEDLMKMLRPEAEKKVKTYLVLFEIGKKENIEVADEELKEEVKKNASQFPNVDLDQLTEYTKEAIKTEKVYKIIDNLIK